MNPTMTAIRAGFARGRIELRQTFTTTQDLLGFLLPSLIFMIVMLFLRGVEIPGAGFSVGTSMLPSVLGSGIAFGGLSTLMSLLTVEREDGTLLRAKATPNGMLGYLIGKIVLVAGTTLAGFALTLIPGLFLFDGLAATSLGSWLTLAWVVVLGLLAAIPLGAIFGSLFPNPRSAGLIMLPVMGLMGISGIFYPLSKMPGFLQDIAQVFPFYWLGLGTRSALLSDGAVAVEIGQSWRTLQTFGVLAVWAAVGLLLAPVVLRRMARRESGSTVAARREKALQRIN